MTFLLTKSKYLNRLKNQPNLLGMSKKPRNSLLKIIKVIKRYRKVKTISRFLKEKNKKPTKPTSLLISIEISNIKIKKVIQKKVKVSSKNQEDRNIPKIIVDKTQITIAPNIQISTKEIDSTIISQNNITLILEIDSLLVPILQQTTLKDNLIILTIILTILVKTNLTLIQVKKTNKKTGETMIEEDHLDSNQTMAQIAKLNKNNINFNEKPIKTIIVMTIKQMTLLKLENMQIKTNKPMKHSLLKKLLKPILLLKNGTQIHLRIAFPLNQRVIRHN